jgi:hypothetical protein
MLFVFDFKDLKKQYPPSLIYFSSLTHPPCPPLFEKERGDFYEFIL